MSLASVDECLRLARMCLSIQCRSVSLFRKTRQEVLARHACVADTDLHDQAFLAADNRNDATQVADEQVEQLRRQLDFHELIGGVGLNLDRLLVLDAVLLDVRQRALVQAANDFDARFDFFGIRPGVNDLVVVIIGFGRRGFDLVRRIRVDEADHEVLHAGFLGRHSFSYRQQLFHGRREVRHVVFDLVEAVFDALGDLDLALTRQ